MSKGVPSPGRRLRSRLRASDEGGQILVLTGVALVLMLCSVGLVVDVGHAMLVQRQLQAGVDAAALAGVQHLPDKTMAETVAHQYSPTPGSKNAVNTVDNATTTALASCLAGVPGCNRRDGGVNGITVTSNSTVPTWFGRIIGINSMKVSARATACSPCQVKPLDIMVVIDRTGSMCQSAPNTWDVNCTDLKNAQAGVETFVGMLDPSLDKVGLALTPPVVNPSWISSCPSPGFSGGDGPTRPGYRPWNSTPNPNVGTSNPARNFNGRYYGYNSFFPYRDFARLPNIPPTGTPDPQGSDPGEYVVASLEGADGNPSDDYLVDDPTNGWVLNKAPGGPGTSAFLQRLNCTSGAGSTSYALSLEAAQAQLNANGRGNVQDIIIFLSDGAANTWPKNLPLGHWTNNYASWGSKPCATGVEMARRIKQAGTIVYTIGYDLDAGAGAPEQCRQPRSSDGQSTSTPEVGYNAFTAIQAMATDPDGAGPGLPLFYNKPNPGQLNDIFRAIAIDLSGSRGRLIDNTSPNLIG